MIHYGQGLVYAVQALRLDAMVSPKMRTKSLCQAFVRFRLCGCLGVLSCLVFRTSLAACSMLPLIPFMPQKYRCTGMLWHGGLVCKAPTKAGDLENKVAETAGPGGGQRAFSILKWRWPDTVRRG